MRKGVGSHPGATEVHTACPNEIGMALYRGRMPYYNHKVA